MRPPPLQGLRVLDFGQMIAVPYVTQVLGWLGAEVILVENPHLQSVRILPPYAEGVRGINRSGGFNMMNTNKRSLVLDIGVPEGLAVAKKLAAISDVVVENFTTGVADKLGLAYNDIRRVRPDVVYLSVAAFGRTGPLKNFAGFHSVVNLFSGVAATTAYPSGHPRILGGFPPDFIGGCYSLLGVLEAVRHRARTGQGQSVETSMTESFTTFIPQAMADYSLHGVEPKAVGNRNPHQAPHGIYVCRGDQRWIAISVQSDEAWAALCEVAGRPDWRDDPRFATAADRCANVEALESLIEEWTRNEEAAPPRRQAAACRSRRNRSPRLRRHPRRRTPRRPRLRRQRRPPRGRPPPHGHDRLAHRRPTPHRLHPGPPARRAHPPRPGRPLADGPGGDRRSGAPRHRHRLR